MKKTLLLLFAFILAVLSSSAQKGEYTILYLMPFDVGGYEAPNAKECEDMDRVRSYGLMGFWNGSQMALEEYADNGVKLNVIVRDITGGEVKLRNVLEDASMMEKVDLIIGPFFSKQFEVASQYAKQYEIPIVNPFTSHHSIIENNDFVFKLKPAPDVRPAMLSYLAQQNNAFPVIVYGDSSSTNKEWRNFKKYFDNNGQKYVATTSASDVVSMLKPEKRQIVLCFEDNTARNLIISRSLLYSKKINNLLFVIPETWLDSKTYDIEYYSQLNLHFFSDYYVDYGSEKTKVFIFDYTQRYGVPPMLSNYAFQGYDVTRFFVEYLLNDNDIDRVKIMPLSYPFTFDKKEGEGYENVNGCFLEIIDNEIVPSEY